MVTQGGPVIPQPTPSTPDSKTTAVLVLDLTSRCNDPNAVCAELIAPVGKFLDKARGAQVPIFYTASFRDKDTDLGNIADGLNRRESETIVHPNSFDKFIGTEFRDALDAVGAQSLVIVGSATNIAVMYTTTAAVRVHKYRVVIPIDGVIASTLYEQEYALHQLHALPAGSVTPVEYSTLEAITFS